MAQYLAIVEEDEETGALSYAKNYGPATVEEYEAYNTGLETPFKAVQDIDQICNSILIFCKQYGIITPDGVMMNGWDFWSVLDFVQKNIDSMVKVKDANGKYSKYNENIPGPAKIIIGSVKAISVPKKTLVPIEFDKAALMKMATLLEGPLTRQLLRDADRRDFLRPIMPDQIREYENPTEQG